MTEAGAISSESALVDDILADAPTDDRGRVALSKLSTDQLSLLGALLDGFDSRADVLRWMQEVAIHSLGQLGDGWFLEQITDPLVVSALVDEPWGPIDPAKAEPATRTNLRRDIAAKDLIAAFHDANRSFRWSATEYYDDEDHADGIDLDAQTAPAMRPGLAGLQERAAWALDQLLAGFADVDAFLIWGQYVVRTTYAEIGRATIRDAYFDEDGVRAWMTSPADPMAAFYRETWAAHFYLPGLNRAAARVGSRTVEIPEFASREATIPR